jgi:hypothetical protein
LRTYKIVQEPKRDSTPKVQTGNWADDYLEEETYIIKELPPLIPEITATLTDLQMGVVKQMPLMKGLLGSLDEETRTFKVKPSAVKASYKDKALTGRDPYVLMNNSTKIPAWYTLDMLKELIAPYWIDTIPDITRAFNGRFVLKFVKGTHYALFCYQMLRLINIESSSGDKRGILIFEFAPLREEGPVGSRLDSYSPSRSEGPPRSPTARGSYVPRSPTSRGGAPPRSPTSRGGGPPRSPGGSGGYRGGSSGPSSSGGYRGRGSQTPYVPAPVASRAGSSFRGRTDRIAPVASPARGPTSPTGFVGFGGAPAATSPYSSSTSPVYPNNPGYDSLSSEDEEEDADAGLEFEEF